MFVFFSGSLQSRVDMRGLSILGLCKKEISMKPKTAAAHMIISGASLPCRPDPLCVCCENNRHCGCFVPPTRRNLEPHRSEWERAKFTHAQTLNYTHTHIRTHAYAYTHGVWTCSKLSTYASRVHCLALSCGKILISARTAARLSLSAHCLSPLLTPLSVLCPLHLLLFCSLVISPPSSPPSPSSPALSPPILPLHLSPQSAPELPCYVGSWEADCQRTHRHQYRPPPLILPC